MEHLHITSDAQLDQLRQRMASAKLIGFDTEFVSEGNYRPQLCLVQVIVDNQAAVIDPLSISDMTPFWEGLAEGSHATVAHSAREEYRFCLHAVGRAPANLFDTQIAAGLVGIEYPASFATLVQRIVGETLHKAETRTNWARRPLSTRQIDYALEDVIHLPALHAELSRRLEKLGRGEWIVQEMAHWQASVRLAEEGDQWRRVKGISGLSRRSLAIVRELWRWRDAEARRRNQPAKRVLRDDLLVELARNQTADAARIQSIRGFERRDLRTQVDDIAGAIRAALELPDRDCPSQLRRASGPQLAILGQFLNAVFSSICRQANLAPGIVGTVQDLRNLAAYRLGVDKQSEPPELATGWRAEIVGKAIDELLAGELTIGVGDPLAADPLKFIRSTKQP